MYEITRDYIRHGNSRSGKRIGKVRFIVSHDTGNPGSTAHGNRNWFDRDQPLASAHTFIDDTYILEIIPLTEKAWHVRYNLPHDNKRFGNDANDCAIGIELCHGGKINFVEAYKRYVWYHAYLCKQFGLQPWRDIVPHAYLDPGRKTDPINVLTQRRITWEQFIEDVEAIYHNEINKTKQKEEGTVAAFKRGDTSQGVRRYQENLKLAGYKISIDGSFGPETFTVTKQFQLANNLQVDGMAGPETLKILAAIVEEKSKKAQGVEFVLGGERYSISKL